MDSEQNKNNLLKKSEPILGNKVDSYNQSKDELIQELRTHQIELEMQNDELRKTQINLEDSQRKYWEIYNFSPIGYLTLDDKGMIEEINLSGASLLQHSRKDLIKLHFLYI